MKLKALTTALVAILLFASCTDEEVAPTQNVIEFTDLKIGNYWVYDWFEIDPDGTESSLNKRDSLYIEKDTTILNRTYLIRSGTFLGTKTRELLYDSANAIFIYPSRQVLFTLDESVKTTVNHGPQNNPIAYSTYSLDLNETTIVVPAGEFECLNYGGLTKSLEADYPYGTRINSNLYSNGTGLILMKTQFYSSPNDLEMRLVKSGKI
ncbi:MAG: hypothetical protein HRT61_10110 [Ekhidna sp.]|nr:hypothetical protein [Ekhidna sp.]